LKDISTNKACFWLLQHKAAWKSAHLVFAYIISYPLYSKMGICISN
jgi:hypothetical protein